MLASPEALPPLLTLLTYFAPHTCSHSTLTLISSLSMRLASTSLCSCSWQLALPTTQLLAPPSSIPCSLYFSLFPFTLLCSCSISPLLFPLCTTFQPLLSHCLLHRSTASKGSCLPPPLVAVTPCCHTYLPHSPMHACSVSGFHFSMQFYYYC